jgi:hypothetical protein
MTYEEFHGGGIWRELSSFWLQPDTGEPLPMWFEKLLSWFRFTQTAVLYPLIFMGYLTNDLEEIIVRCGQR